MKKPKKICETSVRVLETLKFLSENKASVQEIINHFEKIYPNNKVSTSEVVSKYINTLKVFGLKFRKEKDKYVLLTSPVSFDFDRDDLKTIQFIEKIVENFPEGEVCERMNIFLQELEKRFSDTTRVLACSLKKPEFLNLEFNYNNYSEQIKKYEKYCLDAQRLKVIYKAEKKEISVMVEPNEIKYCANEVYLSVYNPLLAQNQDISFDSIVKVEQLPQKINPVNMVSSVTFELKDRLARAYRLHEGERLVQIKENGNIVVLNQKEDRTLLLKRVIRYGENCEILSPKSMREEMKNLIEKTLSNY